MLRIKRIKIGRVLTFDWFSIVPMEHKNSGGGDGQG